MPPKKENSTPTLLEDLIQALQDESVVAALDAIFDKRLTAMTTEITDLKATNVKLSREFVAVNQRVEALEAYSHRADIITTGMSVSSFAEAASTSQSSATGAQAVEHAAATETAVLRLLNNELNVIIAPQDISMAHRLSTKRKTGGDSVGPEPVIVSFTSLKVRDTVCRARLALNEHRTKEGAKLFHEAR